MGRHNDKSIKDVLSDFITSNPRVSKGYHTAQLEEIWKEQMGPIIAGYTQKIYFKEGVLKVYLTSAPLKKELLMGKDKIMSIINEVVNETLITQVEIY
ncbi:MAG: DUF721 domain-containing protein [Saprospiraceae bacterium]|nr:DUF721 domain-containing protein [Saprospiraceae bacterium]